MLRNNNSCMHMGKYDLENINLSISLYENKKFDQISILELGSSNKLSLYYQLLKKSKRNNKLIFKKNKDSYYYMITLQCFKNINKLIFLKFYPMNLSENIKIKIFDFLI